MSIEAGRILKERYRLIRPVGHGSQASVWVAEHLALSTNVAVKLIDPELAKRDSARERFKREATAAARLRSAHVVQMLDHGIDADQPFIVMELLEGEDLYERLTKRKRLSLRETSRIVTQVARALARAHKARIIHRDLKPENVFLVPNEDDEIVKVLDFGVAKVEDPARATKQTGVGTLIGTPHYMSSEQVKGICEIDHRSDLWALGVIAYQCVTGELPFDSEGVGDLLIKISIGELPVPSKVVPSLPESFDAWFAKACERDVEQRFQTARDMAVALSAVAGEVSGLMKAPRPPSQAPRPDTSKSKPPPPKPSVPPAKPKLELKRQSTAELDPSDLQEIEEVDAAWGDPAPPATESVRPDPDVDWEDEEDDFGRPSQDFPPPAVSEPERYQAPPPRPPLSNPGVAAAAAAVPPPRRSTPGPTPVAASNGALHEEPAASSRPHPFIPGVPSEPRVIEATEPSSDRHANKPGLAPTTVSGVSRTRLISDTPPELDGSKRRRMVGWLALGMLAIASVVAWQVIRSQITSRGTTPTSPAVPPPASVAAPVVTTPPDPQLSGTAVDPGTLKHQPKPTPSAKTVPAGRPGAYRKPQDGTIVIPDPPKDE